MADGVAGQAARELATEIIRLLTLSGETVAVAESLTGGLVAAALTDVPGASNAFRGGVIAYATELKAQVLGVDVAMLKRHGPVYPPVAVAMAEGVRPAIELRFDATQYSQRQVLERVAALLDTAPSGDPAIAVPSVLTARDRHGAIRYHRYGQRVTGWRVVSERIGAIKLENPVLYRKAVLCEAIERELMSVLGVDRYEISARDCCAKIEYDPRQLCPVQIIEILDSALANAEHPDHLDRRIVRPVAIGQRVQADIASYGKVTTQGVSMIPFNLCKPPDLDPENVRVVSRFIGGAFGGRNLLAPRCVHGARRPRALRCQVAPKSGSH